ncbi:hypothetical protein B2A_04911, partial [mine drainage metagenome]
MFEVEKGKYSITTDPFIVASQIQPSAYISFLSGLYLLGLTDQVINTIQVVSARRRKGLVFENVSIEFVHFPSTLMFGYTKIRKENSYIMVGEPEKIILDFMYKPGEFGTSYAVEAMRTGLNIGKIENFLLRVNKEAVLARTGYLLEKLGSKIDLHRTNNTV